MPGRGPTPPSSARRTSAPTATPGRKLGRTPPPLARMPLIVITGVTVPERTRMVLAAGHHGGASKYEIRLTDHLPGLSQHPFSQTLHTGCTSSASYAHASQCTVREGMPARVPRFP